MTRLLAGVGRVCEGWKLMARVIDERPDLKRMCWSHESVLIPFISVSNPQRLEWKPKPSVMDGGEFENLVVYSSS